MNIYQGLAVRSLPVVGNETIRVPVHGALAGVAIRAVVGAIVSVVSKEGEWGYCGAAVGAVVLALGGMLLGSITTNNQAISVTRVIGWSSSGVVAGMVVGAVLGWVINLLSRLLPQNLAP